MDIAVITFGSLTENKLSQRGKSGQPIYRLEQLLADPPQPGEPKKMPVISNAQLLAMGIPLQVKIPENSG